MPNFEKLAPTLPGEGPPLPKAMGVRWPWKEKAEKEAKGVTRIGVKLPFPETPKFPKVKLPSPFGSIETPEIKILPKLKPLEMDNRRKEAFRHALGIEGTRLIGFIPVVGHIIAEGIADMHGAKLRELMTPDEFDDYVERTNKALPASLAALRTFHDKPLTS